MPKIYDPETLLTVPARRSQPGPKAMKQAVREIRDHDRLTLPTATFGVACTIGATAAEFPIALDFNGEECAVATVEEARSIGDALHEAANSDPDPDYDAANMAEFLLNPLVSQVLRRSRSTRGTPSRVGVMVGHVAVGNVRTSGPNSDVQHEPNDIGMLWKGKKMYFTRREAVKAAGNIQATIDRLQSR